MFYDFHFLQSDIVFGILNPFSGAKVARIQFLSSFSLAAPTSSKFHWCQDSKVFPRLPNPDWSI